MESLCLKDNRVHKNKIEPGNDKGVIELKRELNEQEQKLLITHNRCNLAYLKKHGVIILGHEDPNKNNYSFFDYDQQDTSISASNLMGVLCLRDKESDTQLQIEVTSRFDNNENHFFLSHLLSKVFRVHIADLIDSSNSSMLDILLALIFIRKLEDATQVGLYKEYRKFAYNDLNLRGRIDLSRHIKHNYPLCDRIAYSTREIAFDNPLNHLLRYAIAKIERKWPNLLENNHNISELVRLIKQNTPTWSPMAEMNVFGNHDVLKEVKHPYFAEFYEPLRTLAFAILQDEGASIYQQEDVSEHDINGVIFDGAWLWEEYLATILEPEGYYHADTAKSSTAINIFKEYKKDKEGNKGKEYKTGTLYPDFRHIIDENNKQACNVILDAKYKRGNARQSKDVHQVLCYMLLTGATVGGLIYPPLVKGEKPDEDVENSKEKKIDTPLSDLIRDKVIGSGDFLWKTFSYSTIQDKVIDSGAFKEYIEKQETALRNFVRDIISKK